MTIDEFMEELKKHPTDWELKKYPTHWEDNYTFNTKLRCFDDGGNGEEGRYFCPITYLYYKKFGKSLPTHDWAFAGAQLGLHPSDTNLIVASADTFNIPNDFDDVLTVTINSLKEACFGN